MVLTNKLKRTAQLLKLVNAVDGDDRPTQSWIESRLVKYTTLGVSSSEKYLSQQAKTDVAFRIMIRLDLEIDQKHFRVRIRGTDYKIVRIYNDEANKTMELSLDYVN